MTLQRSRAVSSVMSFAAALVLFLPIAPAQDQPTQSGPIVIHENHHDTSEPVRELADRAPITGIYNMVPPVHRRPGLPIISTEADPVAQQIELTPVATTHGLNFDGIHDIDTEFQLVNAAT